MGRCTGRTRIEVGATPVSDSKGLGESKHPSELSFRRYTGTKEVPRFRGLDFYICLFTYGFSLICEVYELLIEDEERLGEKVSIRPYPSQFKGRFVVP